MSNQKAISYVIECIEKHPYYILSNGKIGETKEIDVDELVKNMTFQSYLHIHFKHSHIACFGDTKEELLEYYKDFRKEVDDLKSKMDKYGWCTTECWSCKLTQNQACEEIHGGNKNEN